ncbi:phospholipase D (PLD2) [Vairimorpha necatrix]|uniref:phospholipase D n=1 Tax=Vairimorpha necatrix TaxID=6039 RepID=A0AAX4J8P3_9MICR
MDTFEYQKFKDLLEECLLVPFKSLIQPDMNILPRFINFNIPSEDFKTSHFNINLMYGKITWNIKKSKYKLYALCNKLFKQGIRIKSYEKLGNLFSVSKKQIGEIINEILYNMRFHTTNDAFIFFRISKYSFYGLKLYEEKFYVFSTNLTSTCCCFVRSKNIPTSFYIICKSSHILLLDFKNDKIKKIFYYKKKFNYKIVRGALKTSIIIIDNNMKYKITSLHKDRVEKLYEEIENSMLNYNSDNFLNYYCFSPVRYDNIVNFFVDGKNYFEDLYYNLRKAKKEIFLAGWWIFPKLFLKRNKKGAYKKRYRLDHLLKEIASKGVKIYILIYREIQFTVSINSQYTFDILNNLHRNIFIMRHPRNTPNNFIYWTNHEKIVVIDQNIAYLGGIDLCLGRYDTKKHLLFDLKSNKNKSKIKFPEKYDGNIWPGMDFANPLKKDFKFLERAEKSLINRKNMPRMPWHDIQCKIIGGSSFDISLHFIQRWNFLSDNFIVPNESNLSDCNFGNFPYVLCRTLRSISSWSLDEPGEHSIYDKQIEIIRNSEEFIYIENQFFITKSSNDDSHPLNLIGLELVNRIIKAHKDRRPFKVYIVIPILPAFEFNLELEKNSTVMNILKIQSECIIKTEYSLINILKNEGINYEDYILFLSLQKYQKNGDIFQSEQIYAHSKILISDNRKMIVGSANINDRSLLGDRDTEIGLYIEDNKYNEVSDLLKKLIYEHLDFKNVRRRKKEYKDLYSFLRRRSLKLGDDSFFKIIRQVAQENTNLYKEMFSNFLCNEMNTFSKYFKGQETKEKTKEENFRNILGNFVMYPFKFLIDEDLESGFLSLSSIIPDSIYY